MFSFARHHFFLISIMIAGFAAQGCLGKRSLSALTDEVAAGNADTGNTGSGGSDAGAGGGSSGPTTTTASLSPASATLSSASALEVQNSEISLKVASQAVNDACTAPYGATFWALSSENNNAPGHYVSQWMGQSYTPTSAKTIGGVSLRMLRNGPSNGGHIVAKLYSNASGMPATLLSTSTEVDVASIAPSSDVWQDFQFPHAVSVAANSTVHVVITGAAGFTAPEGSQLFWQDISGCSSSLFGVEQYSMDGASWATAYGFDWHYEVKVYENTYPSTSPTATFTKDAGAAATWDLSSFAATENAHSEGGSLRYSVGVSDDGVESYTLVDATLATVRAAGALTGRYLHLQVKFVSDGSKDATVSGLAVNYVR